VRTALAGSEGHYVLIRLVLYGQATLGFASSWEESIGVIVLTHSYGRAGKGRTFCLFLGIFCIVESIAVCGYPNMCSRRRCAKLSDSSPM